MKKKTFLIFGTGRWARIYINYIKQYNYKIYIFSRFKNIDNSLFKKFNLISDKKYLKKIPFNKLFIINKTSDHLKSINIFLKSRIPILLEKPVDHDIFNLKNKYIKNHIYLSLQFSFADYFYFLKRKLANKKITEFELLWNDKIGDKKNYNKKIHFIEDTFYHFFSIVSIFFKSKKILIKNSKNIKISKNQITFEILNKIFLLKVQKDHIKKERILKVRTRYDEFNIDFTKINNVKIYLNNIKIKVFKKNQELIKKQINFFIKDDKKIKKNKLTNQSVLFSNLREIRNSLQPK